LPYSTVDPIMGDIYSVLWEPEMLRSMGDTINILATEVSLLSPGIAIVTCSNQLFIGTYTRIAATVRSDHFGRLDVCSPAARCSNQAILPN